MKKNYEVIDNFLTISELKHLQSLIVENTDFNWNITTNVAYGHDDKDYNNNFESKLWNWYCIHPIYATIPLSPHFETIASIFCSKFDIKSLIRIKINFYPYTSELQEHAKHQDFSFPHSAALFSLNTCDGFTRMPNGDKVDSVENRIVFFDASKDHNSSTTSNQKGRYNINFNWL